jgi:hypothetical protein
MVVSSPWNFDVGSFMVLLGEQEELNYRLMRAFIVGMFRRSTGSGITELCADQPSADRIHWTELYITLRRQDRTTTEYASCTDNFAKETTTICRKIIDFCGPCMPGAQLAHTNY